MPFLFVIGLRIAWVGIRLHSNLGKIDGLQLAVQGGQVCRLDPIPLLNELHQCAVEGVGSLQLSGRGSGIGLGNGFVQSA